MDTAIEKRQTLPDSRLQRPVGLINRGGVFWQPIFCASCGCDGGSVPEENMTFAFYLCNTCAEKHGNIEGTYAEPDIIFWEKVKLAQIEKYGRTLTARETILSLADPESLESKLARDRKTLTPSAGA